MRVSEVYVSIQGEGPRVGKPTTFVRFGGCNLRCPGWPCDTPHAIFPEQYRNEWKRFDPSTLAEETPTWTQNICLTGGEPFLQRADELRRYVNLITFTGAGVECFSNGTIKYPTWAAEEVAFILDWKLPGSGEDPYDAVRLQNIEALRGMGSAVKFTIADVVDYATAVSLMGAYKLEPDFDIYMGVVWGKLDNAELISWILRDQLEVKHNMQIHNIIWDRDKRGI